ncbi:MAG TPA: hypothetical protein DCW52_00270 [Gammaproteobacteria bacterium]|nr:hypothetical protein [Gammaproteobacteria bacterium]
MPENYIFVFFFFIVTLFLLRQKKCFVDKANPLYAIAVALQQIHSRVWYEARLPNDYMTKLTGRTVERFEAISKEVMRFLTWSISIDLEK